MKKIIYILVLMLITINLSSCGQQNTGSVEENTLENNVESIEDNTNTLNNNNINMENIQTEWLQNGNKVAIIKTNTGTIKIKLFTELVPMTTTNFIALSKKWYYDNVIFHRIIKDFMIQWWDPDGTGMGWESIYWEKFDDEFNQNLKNSKYSISMANAWPNTNWSQFFINQNDNNFLDNKHSVFGQVVEWEENVDKISKVKTDSSDKPEKEIKIISIEIKEYQNWIFKDYEFDLDSTVKQIEKDKIEKTESMKDKKIESWNTVSVHYTWTFKDGTKFDSSLDRWEPIEFQVWAWMMIAGFDAWVVWMKIWDKKTLTLSPEQAYWERDDTKTQEIPKTELKSFTDAWIKLEVWVKLPTQMWELEIIEVNDESIIIDANHPMAWKTLIFDIEIINIK